MLIPSALPLATDVAGNPGERLRLTIEQNAPGRSLWYARLGLERLIFDELEAAIDPNASRLFRMIETRARRDYRQRFARRNGRLT